jgi:putative FmdB family regulatory protein
MATYEYECSIDGELITIERPISEPEGNYVCSLCGAKLVRVWSTPAVQFKGSGFYKTDNK